MLADGDADRVAGAPKQSRREGRRRGRGTPRLGTGATGPQRIDRDRHGSDGCDAPFFFFQACEHAGSRGVFITRGIVPLQDRSARPLNAVWPVGVRWATSWAARRRRFRLPTSLRASLRASRRSPSRLRRLGQATTRRETSSSSTREAPAVARRRFTRTRFLRNRLRRRRPRPRRRATCSTRRSRGCARMRHRGAVAADRRTGDGAGVLLPIPPALVPGPWCGLAMVFLRGRGRARSGIEAACAAEGIDRRLAARRRCDAERARRRRPGRRSRGSSSSCSSGRSASAARRRSGARTARAAARSASTARTSRRSRSARSPTRRSARRTSSPRSTPTSATRGSRCRSRSSTSASRRTRRRRGSARSRSGCSATTARSTRSTGTSRRCAPERRASTSEARRRARRRRLRLGAARQRASSCSCAAAATSGTRSQMLVPPAWQDDGARARGARLLRPPRRARRAVGRAGGTRLHRRSRRRRGARPQRSAAAPLRGHGRRTRRVRVRGGRSPAAGRRARAPRPARPRARCSSSTPPAVGLRTRTPRSSAASRGAGPYTRWLATRRRALDVGEPVEPPGSSRPRPRQARAGYTREDLTLLLRAGRVERRTSRLVDGRRHGAAAARRPRASALHVLPPALRAGDEPADRPSARARGDVAAHAAGRARPACSATGAAAARAARARLVLPLPVRLAALAAVHLDASLAEGEACAASCERLAAEAEAAVRGGASMLVLSDARAPTGAR